MKPAQLWKDCILLAAAILVLLLALFLPAACALADPLNSNEERLLTACHNHELIRLHIVANSDGEQDQAIKYAVRDAILAEFGEILRIESTSSEAAFHLLQTHAAEMEALARKTAYSYGFEGEITSQVGYLSLPAKTYGQVTLPAGSYRALRIILGSGEGQNWWCVLYPQLCLTISKEAAGEETVWTSKRIFSQWLAFCK